MSQSEAAQEKRRLDNERSKEWTTKWHQPWTPEEDAILLAEWVNPGTNRDELAVSRKLQRTTYACRIRAHRLAGSHPGTGSGPKPAQPKPPEHYDWMDEWCAETGSAPITNGED